jgi:hypothetical protein
MVGLNFLNLHILRQQDSLNHGKIKKRKMWIFVEKIEVSGEME